MRDNPKEKPLKYITSDNPRVPVTDFPFRHRTPLQIRFTDVDMFGHVNNNVYMAMMDLGKLNYFDAIRNGQLDFHNIAVVVANINISFFAPTYLTEKIEVWTAVESIGERSFVLVQRIISVADGTVKCAARSIMCAIEHDGTSTPLTKDWTDAIKAYEERDFTTKN